jgi:tape measure domain-containing protein
MSLTIQQLKALITADDRDYQRGMQRVERTGRETAQKVKRSFEGMTIKAPSMSGGGMLGSVLGLAGGNLVSGAIIGGLKALAGPLVEAAQAGIDYNKQLENARISFETLIGSADGARKHIADLQRFAATTPFEFTGLVRSSQLLQGMGFESRQVIPMLTGVGNALSAMGRSGTEDVNRVALALGQMSIKGKVSAEEMNQLAEAGLPAWDLLAKAIGKTVAETQKLAERGQLKGREAALAIAQQANLKFGGQMDRMSQTLSGLESNFNDNLMARLGDAAKSGFEGLKSAYKSGGEALGGEAAKGIAAGISQKLDAPFKFLAEEIGLISQGKFGEAGQNAVDALINGMKGAIADGMVRFDQGVLKPLEDRLYAKIDEIINGLGAKLDSLWKDNVPAPVQQGVQNFVEGAKRNVQEIKELHEALKSGSVPKETTGVAGWAADQALKSGAFGPGAQIVGGLGITEWFGKSGFVQWLYKRNSEGTRLSERDQLMLSGQDLFQQGGRRRNLTDVLREEEQKLKPADPRANERVNLLPDVTAPGDIIRVITETNESLKQIPPAVNTLTETFRFWTQTAGQGDGAQARPFGDVANIVGSLDPVAEGLRTIGSAADLIPPKLLPLPPALTQTGEAVDQFGQKILGFKEIVKRASAEEIGQKFGQDFGQSFDNALGELLVNPSNWRDTLSSFANSFFSDLQSAMLQHLTGKSSIGAILGDIVGSFLSGLLGGGAKAGGRASGGPVYAGKAYVWNEPGAQGELFVPASNGYILSRRQAEQAVAAGVAAQGGARGFSIGTLNINVPIHAPGGNVPAQTRRQIATEVAAEIQHVMRRNS